MTRETRILLAVVAGAALTGWLIVSVMSPAPAPEPDVAVREAPADDEPLAAAPEPEPPRAARPRAPVPGATAAPDEDPSEAIVHDLQVLVRAVRKDKHVEELAFPESTRILDLPSVIHYVRTVEFWGPAFTKAEVP